MLRKPYSGLMQLAMSLAFNARGQIRRCSSGPLELSGERAPARCQIDLENRAGGERYLGYLGAGGLTSPH